MTQGREMWKGECLEGPGNFQKINKAALGVVLYKTQLKQLTLLSDRQGLLKVSFSKTLYTVW